MNVKNDENSSSLRLFMSIYVCYVTKSHVSLWACCVILHFTNEQRHKMIDTQGVSDWGMIMAAVTLTFKPGCVCLKEKRKNDLFKSISKLPLIVLGPHSEVLKGLFVFLRKSIFSAC